MPTSPRKGLSARLRREAGIELLTSTRLSSPRKSATEWARPPPRPLPRYLFLSIFRSRSRAPPFPPKAPAAAHRPTAADYRHRRRRCHLPPPQTPRPLPLRDLAAASPMVDAGIWPENHSSPHSSLPRTTARSREPPDPAPHSSPRSSTTTAGAPRPATAVDLLPICSQHGVVQRRT
jgi:hypothetical protein